jgi:protein-S-isoprenylcysteine O-methyltransferase Ste14
MARRRRETGWFVLQSALFVAMLASPLAERRAPAALTRLVGLGLLWAGVGVARCGYRELGRSHSPWTEPTGEGLVTTGIYGQVRHPIYAGWCLGGLGFEILFGSRLGLGVVGGVALFYDLKAREEEKLLDQQYPDGARYRAAVDRFIPGVY